LTVRLFAFECGRLELPYGALLKGEKGRIEIPVPSYLIEHPKGRVLFDSGLNQLEYNDDGGSGLFSRIDRLCGTDALPAGTYYVWIAEYESNDEIPSYDITLTVVQECGAGYLLYVPVVEKNYR